MLLSSLLDIIRSKGFRNRKGAQPLESQRISTRSQRQQRFRARAHSRKLPWREFAATFGWRVRRGLAPNPVGAQKVLSLNYHPKYGRLAG